MMTSHMQQWSVYLLALWVVLSKVHSSITCRYDIMLKCWLANADERPPFSKLVALVSADLERQAGYLDVSSIPSASFLSENEGREKCIPSLSAMSPTIPLIVITRPDNEVEEL